MSEKEIRKIIEEFIDSYVRSYQIEHEIANIWKHPLVGYADANHEYIRKLPEIVCEQHCLPEDFLEFPSVIVSYFIPFSEKLAKDNANETGSNPSMSWVQAYNITNEMMVELSRNLVEKIRSLGYRAEMPQGVGMLMDIVKSNWSQRHIAYAAGLGTFGINNMLITDNGCCGRFHSIVADLPIKPDRPKESENCLYKRKGVCGVCIRKCPSGALSTNGFDRMKCFAICMLNMKALGADVCGKCDVEIPCAYTRPN